MPRIRQRRARGLRGFDWLSLDDELAQGVPLDRYTSALARWAAKAPHW